SDTQSLKREGFFSPVDRTARGPVPGGGTSGGACTEWAWSLTVDRLARNLRRALCISNLRNSLASVRHVTGSAESAAGPISPTGTPVAVPGKPNHYGRCVGN